MRCGMDKKACGQ